MSTLADGGRDDPGTLTPSDLVDRYLRKRQTDRSDQTLRSYENRLGRWLKWIDTTDIATMQEVTPWMLDEYDLWLRNGDRSPATIKGHLTTLRVMLRYAADIGAVDDDLPEAVDVPRLDPAEEQSNERLDADDATAALEFFRDSPRYFGVGMHALLEVAWHTGARLSGLRALDLRDYDSDEQFVEFVHRPDTGTPLKNNAAGERYVGLTETVCDVLDYYIARERSDERDDHGRQPLWAGRQGRQSGSTLRAWSYQATQPCLWTSCPHGKERSSCEWTKRSHCSKCPSSRAPHRIRTGSITWQLNQGIDIEDVATRVNASPEVIRRHYDAASREEEFAERRRSVEQSLGIDNAGDTNE